MNNLINEKDLIILSEVKKEPQSILLLQCHSMMAYKNFKKHLDRLEKMNFLYIEPAKKGLKKYVKITKLGERVLSCFKDYEIK